MIIFNLKEIMKKKEMTLTELAQKSELSINTLSLLSTGKSKGIQFETLEKILNVLECDVEDLIINSESYVKLEIKDVKKVDDEMIIINVVADGKHNYQNFYQCIYLDENNNEEKLLLTVSDFPKMKMINISGKFPTKVLIGEKVRKNYVEFDIRDKGNDKLILLEVFMALIFNEMKKRGLYKEIYDRNNHKGFLVNFYPYYSHVSFLSYFTEIAKNEDEDINKIIKEFSYIPHLWRIEDNKLLISRDFYIPDKED